MYMYACMYAYMYVCIYVCSRQSSETTVVRMECLCETRHSRDSHVKFHRNGIGTLSARRLARYMESDGTLSSSTVPDLRSGLIVSTKTGAQSKKQADLQKQKNK